MIDAIQSGLVERVDAPRQLLSMVSKLRKLALADEIDADTVLTVFEKWSKALEGEEFRGDSGVTFLRLWLRRSNLEPILIRELGANALGGGWQEDGSARLRAFPLGVVGHWPAGNVDIQPVLSLTCALLGGNASLVRVPGALVEVTRRILARLEQADTTGTLLERVRMVHFDHSRNDLHRSMAIGLDGAMIWGGEEAVSQIRSLPFPPWARIVTFGPRVSAAAIDGATWADAQQRRSWCRRIARDLWQFDQQACSSPQTLFLERGAGLVADEFFQDLRRALEDENRQHPRRSIEPALASNICTARAEWLLQEDRNRALFPDSPDWTLLMGSGTAMPKPTQGRTLTVLVVDDLEAAISRFDGTVQTLALAIGDPEREQRLAQVAGNHGVDRIVKPGRMHVFGSPWDGVDLIRPLVRRVRYVPSHERGVA